MNLVIFIRKALNMLQIFDTSITKVLSAFVETYHVMHYKSCHKYFVGFKCVRNLAKNIKNALNSIAYMKFKT